MTRGRRTRRRAWLVLALFLWSLPAAAEPVDPALAAYALDLVNDARRAQGLPDLRPDPRLAAAAQAHAEDMLRRDYFAHVSPEGDSAFDRYVEAGGDPFAGVSENIARCRGCGDRPGRDDVERAQADWMESPGHRAAILDPALTAFGFGAAGAGDRQYAVQTFAGPGAERLTAAGRPAVYLSPESRGALALDLVNAARREAGAPALQPSADLTGLARRLVERLAARPGESLPDDALYDLLPAEARDRWRALSVLTLDCGGCGRDPTDADVEHAVRSWREDGAHAPVLRDGRFGGFGFALLALGQGRKLAVAVFGQPR